MIKTISSKSVNPNGQLDHVEIPSMLAFLPIAKDININKVDKNNLILVGHQFVNLEKIIEIARSYLIFSSETISQAICKQLFSFESNEDLMLLSERISFDFVFSAILYFNASFDYFKPLLKCIYSTYEEIINHFSIEKVKSEMKNKEIDWILALASCVSRVPTEKFYQWVCNHSKISENVKTAYRELREKNNELKIKYKANQIKHFAIPSIKYTSCPDLHDALIFEDIEQFYNKKNRKTITIFGGTSYKDPLMVNEAQIFLIDYNNCSIKLLKEILSDIGLYNWQN